jgi:hypothetical protein
MKGDTKTRAEVLDLTPQMCEMLLKNNHDHNRKVRRDLIVRYTRLMLTGKWMKTGMSMSVDLNGRLIDGQHRCLAAIQAGYTIKQQVVVYELPDDAVWGTDCGQGRTAKEMALMTEDAPVKNIQVAVAKLIEDGGGFSGRRGPVEEMELVKKFQTGILFATGYGRINGGMVAPIRAAVARAYYIYTKPACQERLKRFMEVYSQPETSDGKGDSSAVKLKTYMLAHGQDHLGMNGRKLVYNMAETAIMAFLHKKEIKSNKIPPARQELFPISWAKKSGENKTLDV